MQLSYRGAAYQLPQHQISTIESDTRATFLGRRYRIRQVRSLPQSSPTGELTYRGVKYGGPAA
ncbi:MAG: DUF4278 domain-containing protein [Cyanobacteria bacterium J06554_6]